MAVTGSDGGVIRPTANSLDRWGGGCHIFRLGQSLEVRVQCCLHHPGCDAVGSFLSAFVDLVACTVMSANCFVSYVGIGLSFLRHYCTQ